MKNANWTVPLAMTVLCLSYTPISQAQVTNTSMSAPTVSTSTLGQDQTVSYNNKFAGIKFGKTISKTVTIEPGNQQISLDGLGLRNRVNLTLVNPSSTPLQFETTQRWGKQIVAVVPPHSQEMVAFSNSRPFTHEIKYFVMQQPSNAISTNEDYVTQQAAAVSAEQQAAIRSDLERQSAMMRQALDQQTAQIQNSQTQAIHAASKLHQTQGRSAVRGYW